MPRIPENLKYFRFKQAAVAFRKIFTPPRTCPTLIVTPTQDHVQWWPKKWGAKTELMPDNRPIKATDKDGYLTTHMLGTVRWCSLGGMGRCGGLATPWKGTWTLHLHLEAFKKGGGWWAVVHTCAKASVPQKIEQIIFSLAWFLCRCSLWVIGEVAWGWGCMEEGGQIGSAEREDDMAADWGESRSSALAVTIVISCFWQMPDASVEKSATRHLTNQPAPRPHPVITLREYLVKIFIVNNLNSTYSRKESGLFIYALELKNVCKNISNWNLR